MKLQKNRKRSNHIYNTVYSKMKLFQPNKIVGIHTENMKFLLKSHVIKTIFLQ